MIKIYNQKSLKEIQEEREQGIQGVDPTPFAEDIQKVEEKVDKATEEAEKQRIEVMTALAESIENAEQSKIMIMTAVAEGFELLASQNEVPNETEPTDEKAEGGDK